MDYVIAFVVGGVVCALTQSLMEHLPRRGPAAAAQAGASL